MTVLVKGDCRFDMHEVDYGDFEEEDENESDYTSGSKEKDENPKEFLHIVSKSYGIGKQVFF